MEELSKYLQRKGITIDNLEIDDGKQPPTPQGGRCWTPPTAHLATRITKQATLSFSYNLPKCPALSSSDKTCTHLFHAIGSYYSAKFQSTTRNVRGRDIEISDLYPSMKFGGYFQIYHSLQTLKHHDKAYQKLDLAFSMIRTLLDAQDTRLLTYLLESMSFC